MSPTATAAIHRDHEVVDLRAARHDAAASASRARAARSLLGLSALLSERPELRGVHAPADLAAESIRWAV